MLRQSVHRREEITGSRRVLEIGMWAAWASVFLFLIYDVVVFAGGAFQGVFHEPYLSIAEGLSILGACILIVLMAAIYISAPSDKKIMSLIAFGWILLLHYILIHQFLIAEYEKHRISR